MLRCRKCGMCLECSCGFILLRKFPIQTVNFVFRSICVDGKVFRISKMSILVVAQQPGVHPRDLHVAGEVLWGTTWSALTICLSQQECPDILSMWVFSSWISSLENRSYGILYGIFLYTSRRVFVACRHLLLSASFEMSVTFTGSNAKTLTSGSERFVSLHVTRQSSQSLTSKYSDLVWMNDGMVPLPVLHWLQKTFPQSLQ